MFPDVLVDFLETVPAFVINLDRRSDRWEYSSSNIRHAGFKNMIRWSAVDVEKTKEELDNMWWDLNVSYDWTRMRPVRMGCTLSHLRVWKYIVDQEIPYAMIFEDDVFFHKDWPKLSEEYYRNTPKHSDVIFMGHHCGNVGQQHRVVKTPVYCLHGYAVTLQGAKRLLHLLTTYPYDDTWTIDAMLVRVMHDIIREQKQQLDWCVWNAEMYPDENTEVLVAAEHRSKDKGLIFQKDPALF